MGDRLAGKRVLVTMADRYMGPAIVELFRAEGADVVDDRRDLTQDGAADAAVSEAGAIDVLVANLAEPPHQAPVGAIDDADWHRLFDVLVHPLMRLVRAATPAMVERGSGKIVAVTSAAPLRGIPLVSGYCAARGAQNAFIRAVGLELARNGVHVNAIAQNYVHNDTYYPPGLTEDERFVERMRQVVPVRRLGEGRETAELALYLASEHSGFMVGQVLPFAGGWVTST